MGDVVINVRMPWVCSVINKRWRQNVIRINKINISNISNTITSVTNSTATCCYPFSFLQTFWRHLRVLTEQTRGNMEYICQVNGEQSIICLASFHSGVWGKKGEEWIHGKIQFPTSPPPFLVSFLRSYIDWKSLLHQNISHSFNVSVTIIWGMKCCVSTRIGVIRASSGTKPNSGVTRGTIVLLVSYITNSCFRIITWGAYSIEAFLVTVRLQRALFTNLILPLVTTQWRSAPYPISDQGEQRVGLLVNDNKPELSTYLHTETDLGERCVPIGR